MACWPRQRAFSHEIVIVHLYCNLLARHGLLLSVFFIVLHVVLFLQELGVHPQPWNQAWSRHAANLIASYAAVSDDHARWDEVASLGPSSEASGKEGMSNLLGHCRHNPDIHALLPHFAGINAGCLQIRGQFGEGGGHFSQKSDSFSSCSS